MHSQVAQVSSLRDILNSAHGVINALFTVIIALAVLVFFWGLATFLLNADDEKKHDEGKNRMLWGTIALFVIVSVWGLVYFLQVALGLEAYSPPDPGVRDPIPGIVQPNVPSDPHPICVQYPGGPVCIPGR